MTWQPLWTCTVRYPFEAHDSGLPSHGVDRFNRIRTYQYYDIDNRGIDWAQQRDNQDLEIFGNADYIVSNPNAMDPSVQYWDMTRSCPIANDDLLLYLHEDDVLESAVTCPATPDGDQQVFPAHWSETITFHPAYLQDGVDNPLSFADRVTAAKSSALLHLARSREPDPARRARVTQFDLLLPPEQVLMHEVGRPSFSACTVCIKIEAN